MKRSAIVFLMLWASAAFASPPASLVMPRLKVEALTSPFASPAPFAITHCPSSRSCPWVATNTGAWGYLHVDGSGNLLAATGSPTAPLSACPSQGACPFAINPSGNFVNLSTDSSGNLLVTLSGGGGGGTVTSVGLTMPSWFSVANSPVIGAGTLAVTAATAQTAHQVIGTCGATTSFAPCALVAGDLPSTLTSGTAITNAALTTPTLGTPASGTLTNATGLPVATGISGLGTNVATSLANTLNAASGLVGFSGALGTPTSGVVTNLTGTGAFNTTGTAGGLTSTNFNTAGATLTLGSVGGTAGSTALLGTTSGSVAWNCSPTTTCGTMQTSAPLSVGKISTINSIATSGSVGVEAVRAAPVAVVIGSGSSIGSTSLCTAALCTVGLYDIHVYVEITTACTTTGTYQVNLIYTDDQGSKTIVAPLAGTGVTYTASGSTPVDTVGLASTSNFGAATVPVFTTGATTINYSTTAVACGTGGPMVGKMIISATTAN